MTCPSCGFIYSYEENDFLVCSSCQFRWKIEEEKVYKDAYGNTYGTEILFGDMYEIFCEILFNLKDLGYTHFDTNSPIIYDPA